MNVLDLETLFGPGGPLSKNLPYYEYRPSQIEYARAVQSAFDEKKIALVEAQTGTGKTLAYLIPALQTGRRVIISTGTKALQEQLVYKDIPLLREKLGIEFESLLMKGRMNYLCLLKQERSRNTLPESKPEHILWRVPALTNADCRIHSPAQQGLHSAIAVVVHADK